MHDSDDFNTVAFRFLDIAKSSGVVHYERR